MKAIWHCVMWASLLGCASAEEPNSLEKAHEELPVVNMPLAYYPADADSLDTPPQVEPVPAGTEFALTPVVVDPMIPGASRLEATTTLNLAGLTEDVWIVAVVRGTDGVSQPTFPVIPYNLDTSNTTLADLIDGNLGEGGVPTLAYTNPVFVDVDGGGWTPPGVQFNP